MRTKLTSDAELLTQIERFCAAHGIKPTTFGRQAIGDGNLIPSMRKGKRSLTLKTAARVVEFMTGYQQAAARPTPSQFQSYAETAPSCALSA